MHYVSPSLEPIPHLDIPSRSAIASNAGLRGPSPPMTNRAEGTNSASPFATAKNSAVPFSGARRPKKPITLNVSGWNSKRIVGVHTAFRTLACITATVSLKSAHFFPRCWRISNTLTHCRFVQRTEDILDSKNVPGRLPASCIVLIYTLL